MKYGCPGCLISEQQKQEVLKSVYDKALEYAKQIQKLVIVYEDDEGVPNFMEAEAAKLAGLRPIRYAPVM